MLWSNKTIKKTATAAEV